MERIDHWLAKRLTSSKALHTIIIMGIDYPSFAFAKYLQNEAKDIRIIALIDEEPWANKTQIHGITVHYPSDLMALIEKYKVKLVVAMEGQKPQLATSYLEKIKESAASLIHLDKSAHKAQLLSLRHALQTATTK